MAAKPPLVVASAAKPSEASSRAEPGIPGVGQQQRAGALVEGAEDARPFGLGPGCTGLIGTGRRHRHAVTLEGAAQAAD